MFRTLRFGLTDGQIGVSYISIITRRRWFTVIEIGTVQKYPQVFGYSGDRLLIGASDSTFPETYSPEAAVTEVHFPPCLTGWEILPDPGGRYTLRVAFYKTRGSRDSCEIIRVPSGVIWDGKPVQ